MNSQTYVTRSVGVGAEVALSTTVTTTLLQNCRLHRISLGAALTVLAQMATARVLHRRYMRGEISEQEWEHIRKQPTHSRGPLSTRPYLDKDWRSKGGDEEVMVAITYFWCTLPSFPSPPGFSKSSVYSFSDGVPSFADLLSHRQFVYRCNMVRNEMKEQVTHPFLMDMSEFHQRDFLDRKRKIYQHWHASLNGETSQNDLRLNGLREGLAFTYEWTTVGDVSFHIDFLDFGGLISSVVGFDYSP